MIASTLWDYLPPPARIKWITERDKQTERERERDREREIYPRGRCIRIGRNHSAAARLMPTRDIKLNQPALHPSRSRRLRQSNRIKDYSIRDEFFFFFLSFFLSHHPLQPGSGSLARPVKLTRITKKKRGRRRGNTQKTKNTEETVQTIFAFIDSVYYTVRSIAVAFPAFPAG